MVDCSSQTAFLDELANAGEEIRCHSPFQRSGRFHSSSNQRFVAIVDLSGEAKGGEQATSIRNNIINSSDKSETHGNWCSNPYLCFIVFSCFLLQHRKAQEIAVRDWSTSMISNIVCCGIILPDLYLGSITFTHEAVQRYSRQP